MACKIRNSPINMLSDFAKNTLIEVQIIKGTGQYEVDVRDIVPPLHCVIYLTNNPFVAF